MANWRFHLFRRKSVQKKRKRTGRFRSRDDVSQRNAAPTKDVTKVISTYKNRQKAEAGGKLDVIAKESCHSHADLIGVEMKTTCARGFAKYTHQGTRLSPS